MKSKSILLIVGAFFVGNVAVTLYVSHTFGARQEAERAAFLALLSRQEQLLTTTRADIAVLERKTGIAQEKALAESKLLAAQLQSESVKRQSAEAKSKLNESQLATLESRLTQSVVDVSAIYTTWKSRVLHVECDWRTAQGQLYVRKSASALLTRNASGPVAITNAHVVLLNNETLPTSCRFISSVDDSSITIQPWQLTVNTDLDYAIAALESPSGTIAQNSATKASVCANKASVGESILIMGYPVIGSENDVTATEGIISGYDGSYYITSAKVEQGNSGGAAIHVKNNCYLGIPTFVNVGSVESLARLLDARLLP